MKFDLSKINVETQQGGYNVKFALYKEDKGFKKDWTFDALKEAIQKKEVVGAHNGGYTVCFRDIRTMMRPEYNRMLFEANFEQQKNYTGIVLTLLERKKWTTLCRHHGLLPSYTGRHYYHTGNIVFDLTGKTTSRLYAELIAARTPQECPETARAAIYFRSKGLNFFLALLAAGRCTWSATGHTFFTQGKQYAVTTDPHTATVVPNDALALKIYLKNGYRDDNKTIRQRAREGTMNNYPLFKLHDMIGKTVADLKWQDGAKNVPLPDLINSRYQNILKAPVEKVREEMKQQELNFYRSNRARPRKHYCEC